MKRVTKSVLCRTRLVIFPKDVIKKNLRVEAAVSSYRTQKHLHIPHSNSNLKQLRRGVSSTGLGVVWSAFNGDPLHTSIQTEVENSASQCYLLKVYRTGPQWDCPLAVNPWLQGKLRDVTGGQVMTSFSSDLALRATYLCDLQPVISPL